MSDDTLGPLAAHGMNYEEIEAVFKRIRAGRSRTMAYVDVVFDGPPGPEAGRFIEVENEHGQSINVGKWIERLDGHWVLRLEVAGPRQEFLATGWASPGYRGRKEQDDG